MKLTKTKPSFTFAMICKSSESKKLFKSSAGIKGRKWFETEKERDDAILSLKPLASKFKVDLIPEVSDISFM